MKADPVLLEVYKNLMSEAAEEMGVTLMRTAFSPNIKERRDFSCAIFDGSRRLAAQAMHIPVHLGSMPGSVAAMLEKLTLDPGDAAIMNDPFQGGTHLPDITMAAPVFAGAEKPLFYVANRAHHADVGGMSPGSMPLASQVYAEGLIIPPLKLVQAGRMVEPVIEMILANVRTPQEREGDLASQLAALKVGAARLSALVREKGAAEIEFYMAELMDYSERMMRALISQIPDGVYEFEDFLDDGGLGGPPVPIRVRLAIAGAQVLADFTGSAPHTAGPMNAGQAITTSAVSYAFLCLAEGKIPPNDGAFRPIQLKLPPGSVVNARPPAAVAGGNVETSQRIVDVVLGALAKARPDLAQAASAGTMNNLTIGGARGVDGRPFAYYETLGGGMGAGPAGPGLGGVQTHMTNTMNTPIEALEHAYPFLAEEYSLRKGSGGRGQNAGGDGLVRRIRMLDDVEVCLLTERRKLTPYGLAGGHGGEPGQNLLIDAQGRATNLPGKARLNLTAGQAIELRTPGGGGWGPPAKPGAAPKT